MKLNVKNYKVADRLLDLLIGKGGPEKVSRLYLGIKEINGLGLNDVENPTFFQIPVQIVNKNSYISLETRTNE